MFFKKIKKEHKNLDFNQDEEKNCFLKFKDDFVIDIRKKNSKIKKKVLSPNFNKNSKKRYNFFSFIKNKKDYKFNFLNQNKINNISFLNLFKQYFFVNKYIFKSISKTNIHDLSIISFSKLVFHVSFNIGWLFLFFVRFLIIFFGLILYKSFLLLYSREYFQEVFKSVGLFGIAVFKKIKLPKSIYQKFCIKKKIVVKSNIDLFFHLFVSVRKYLGHKIERLKLILMKVQKRKKGKKIALIQNRSLNIKINKKKFNIKFKLSSILKKYGNKFLSLIKSGWLSVLSYVKINLYKVFSIFRNIFSILNNGVVKFKEITEIINNGLKNIIINRKDKFIKNRKLKKKIKDIKIELDKKEHKKIENVYFGKYFVFKSVFLFLALVIFLIAPFKGFVFYKSLNLETIKIKIIEASGRAVDNLYKASGDMVKMNTSDAINNFSEADNNFLKAKQYVDEINGLVLQLSKFSPKKEVRMASVGKQILETGIIATKLGSDTTLFFDELRSINGEVFVTSSDVDMINAFNDLENRLTVMNNDLNDLNISILKIDVDVLPDKYRDEFKEINDKIIHFSSLLKEMNSLINNIKIFLGVESDKKYLLVFQNSNEVRATGGFIGSIALVDFSKGRLKSLNIPEGGSYDLDGNLEEFVKAPKPLQLVTPRWFFRDANWWPDWSLSAKKLMWFYEHSGGETVDGCISFTPDILGEVLKITGPIDMTEKYGVVINQDNFWEIIRENIEKNKKTNTPKTIIKDIFNEVINRFSTKLNKDKIVQILKIIEDSLSSKNVLFYFNDDKLQGVVEEKKWGGRIKDTNKDYLSVINTNIAGGKSDKKIKQTITLDSEIMEDGSIVDTLRIKREHTASFIDNSYYKTRNVDWLRVYVPKGSVLIDASGFNEPDSVYFEDPDDNWNEDEYLKKEEDSIRSFGSTGASVYVESGKTVFAGWSMVDSGGTEVIYMKYKLPFSFGIEQQKNSENEFINGFKKIINKDKKNFYSYSLLVQKQPGASNVNIKTSLIVPDIYNVNWKYPDNIKNINNKLSIENRLKKDQFWAVLFSD